MWAGLVVILSGGVNITLVIQDKFDSAALRAELHTIIRSGILDLGVFGLWTEDNLQTSTSRPSPR